MMKTKTRKYHVLLIRWTDRLPWTIEFGAYSLSDVRGELEDALDSNPGLRRKSLKIVSVPVGSPEDTLSDNDRIMAVVSSLNASL
jgi:hypothetical protein